ncbi:unnamed protein product [Ceutorhynchus assimilis]|uniref:Uncharacterized protein n=1 Tax=Ceutorhynchus assimilis TaxID=467358 RepID=A0A9N9QS62_9CUCU|nr:unnamed protein product [Ceutorhynchus assimilis]
MIMPPQPTETNIVDILIGCFYRPSYILTNIIRQCVDIEFGVNRDLVQVTSLRTWLQKQLVLLFVPDKMNVKIAEFSMDFVKKTDLTGTMYLENLFLWYILRRHVNLDTKEGLAFLPSLYRGMMTSDSIILPKELDVNQSDRYFMRVLAANIWNDTFGTPYQFNFGPCCKYALMCDFPRKLSVEFRPVPYFRFKSDFYYMEKFRSQDLNWYRFKSTVLPIPWTGLKSGEYKMIDGSKNIDPIYPPTWSVLKLLFIDHENETLLYIVGNEGLWLSKRSSLSLPGLVMEIDSICRNRIKARTGLGETWLFEVNETDESTCDNIISTKVENGKCFITVKKARNQKITSCHLKYNADNRSQILFSYQDGIATIDGFQFSW